ncbi:MAG: exosortase-associated EpsI family protein [Verrucomicrobia bacterium]|nr:exosortase-associated EpsI family protein [Verrucomicrobiota bacterium]
MNILFKNALFALSCIPFLTEMPYVLNVWKISPLERGGWIIWIAALVSLVVCELCRRKSPWNTYYEEHYSSSLASSAWFIVLMVLSLAACVFFRVGPHKVHAFYMLSSISLIISAVGWRFGVSVFMFQLPTCFFVLLGAPTIAYWIYSYLGYNITSRNDYLITKLILGSGVMFVWCAGAILSHRIKTPRPQMDIPKPLHLLFALIVAGLFFWALASEKMSADGQPVELDFSHLQSASWVGREDPVTERDINFFTGCTEINRRTYFNDDSYVNVLALRVKDITNLHPMDVCLRSSGAEIISLKPVYLEVNGLNIALNEARIRRDSSEYYSYAIYSNGLISTGDFAKFRLLRRDSRLWVHYQMVTPAQPDEEAVHARMESFLGSFLKQTLD